MAATYGIDIQKPTAIKVANDVTAAPSPPPSPSPPPLAPPPPGLPMQSATRSSSGPQSWCSDGGNMGEVRTGIWFCLAWQEEPDTSTMLFTMESYTSGYVSVGFGEKYGMMTPADC
eukprot:9254494-Pyramimonas_sp.AAC.1